MRRVFIRKPVRAATNTQLRTQEWPSSRRWRNVDFEDDGGMWDKYLAEPESRVNEELQIFPEPCIQDGIGDMFINDESSNGYDAILVDFGTWCEDIAEMAASSRSAAEYEDKYREYVTNLINENWN